MPERVATEEFYPDEPTGPILVTDGPSIKTQNEFEAMKDVFDPRYASMVANYEKSIGNYISDVEGNSYLDVLQQIASIGLGYNNPILREITKSEDMISAIVNRSSTGRMPPHWYPRALKGMLTASPPGLDKIWICLSGSDANDNAIKAAFMYYRSMERGYDATFTQEELDSALEGNSPGNPDLAILSFYGGFHGRTLGSGTLTAARAYTKVDFPAFKWPKAKIPTLKYPLDKYAEENHQAEVEALAEVEKIYSEWHCPIAATIIEPILSEGGDVHCSAFFYQGLRDITKKHNSLLILDEVQTGLGATGKLWAHEYFNLTSPPDLVTFSKKFQAAGFFYGNPQIMPKDASRMYNTWTGDPARVLIAEGLAKVIADYDLVAKTKEVGDYIFPKMEALQEKYPEMMMNLRGKNRGTFIGFDVPDAAFRAKFWKTALSVGLNIGGGHVRTVRLRPSLTFNKSHADVCVELLDKTFAIMQKQ